MNDHDVIRLRHMLDAAREVIAFVSNKSRGDLDTDPVLLRALERSIEIIGEAASHVTGETQRANVQSLGLR